MVEKLKAEIKGSLIYWVCDSQTNYVQFNIVLKYDPEGSDFLRRKKNLFSIFAWNTYYSKSLKIWSTEAEDNEKTNVHHSLWSFKSIETKLTGAILMKTEDLYKCEVP